MTPAVGIFTALVAYFAARSARPAAARPVHVARRYLRPFAIWALIFVVLRSADAIISGENVGQTLLIWIPPAGTMHHLWFLPFAAVVAWLSPRLAAVLRAGPGGWLGPTLLLVAATGWILLWDRAAPAQGLYVLGLYVPSALLGLMLAILPAEPGQHVRAGAAFVLLGTCLSLTGIPASTQILVGLPIVAAVLAMPSPSDKLTLRLAELSLWIYLAHPLVMAILLRLTDLQLGSPLLGVLVLAVTALVGRLQQSTRLFRLLT